VTGSVCLDYIHSIKKLESDPDLAIQVQVSPSDAHSVSNFEFYLTKFIFVCYLHCVLSTLCTIWLLDLSQLHISWPIAI